jgi:hypothetical protein
MKFMDYPPFRSYITILRKQKHWVQYRQIKTGVNEKEAMRESSSTPTYFAL